MTAGADASMRAHGPAVRWRRLWGHAAPPLVGLALLLSLLALWEGAVALGYVAAFTAPPPSTILASVPGLLADENLPGALLQTFAETLGAAVLAALIGIPIGWALHHTPRLGRAYESWVAASAAAPLVLLYPLFLVILGRNAATIVAMGVIAGLPPIILKTKEGFDGIRRAVIDVGRSFRLTPRQQLTKVLLPAATPTIGSGLRLALIFALINIVGVEYLINFGGMGAIIADLADRFELGEMFAAIAFVVLTSICFYLLTGRIERWLRRV